MHCLPFYVSSVFHGSPENIISHSAQRKISVNNNNNNNNTHTLSTNTHIDRDGDRDREGNRKRQTEIDSFSLDWPWIYLYSRCPWPSYFLLPRSEITATMPIKWMFYMYNLHILSTGVDCSFHRSFWHPFLLEWSPSLVSRVTGHVLVTPSYSWTYWPDCWFLTSLLPQSQAPMAKSSKAEPSVVMGFPLPHYYPLQSILISVSGMSPILTHKPEL